MTNAIAFVTMVSEPGEIPEARRMMDSIRAFGGPMSACPVWLFEADPDGAPCGSLAGEGVEVVPLTVPDALRRCFFGGKVWACAEAERMAVSAGVRSLVWMDTNCLVVQPPLLYDLGDACDAAVRPVHIQNVGLRAGAPLDGYWRGIYRAVGVEDISATVESYVDGQTLRAYFNSHAFAIRPDKGLMRRRAELFEALAGDQEFQAAHCQDVRRRIFLFQAVWSALLVNMLDWERVRILPPEYNYPYNLQDLVPPERRARALNDLVTVACEERNMDPAAMNDIEVREPLRSWLAARAKPQINADGR